MAKLSVFETSIYAGRHNLTFSIFTMVSRANEPSDGERRLLEAVRRALAP